MKWLSTTVNGGERIDSCVAHATPVNATPDFDGER
jgi:hypothetical protein